MEFSKVISLDEKFSVVWKTQAKYSRMSEDVFGHSAGIFADKADGMGDLVKAFANGVKVAKRHQFALVENDDLFGDAFDFTEDVTADEDGSSQLTQLADNVHDGGSSEGVATLERLVEDDEFRVIHQCMSNFCPLAHSFGKSSDFLVGDIREADEC